jgi:hypothetical protein
MVSREASEPRILAWRLCLVCRERPVREIGLCSNCHPRTWHEVNRAFCALIHRDRPFAAFDDPQ